MNELIKPYVPLALVSGFFYVDEFNWLYIAGVAVGWFLVDVRAALGRKEE